MRRPLFAAGMVAGGFLGIIATVPMKDVQLELFLCLIVLAGAILLSGLIHLALPPEGARHRRRLRTEPRLIAGYRVDAPRAHGRSH